MTGPDATQASRIRALLAKAIQFVQRGSYGEAEPMLSRILEASSDDFGALRMMGYLRYRQGRLAEAADLLSRSLRSNASQPDAKLNLAHVLLEMGKAEDAVALLIGLTGESPDYLEAQLTLASTFHQMGKLEEAERYYRQALPLSSDQTRTKLGLAGILVDAGRPAEAEAVARSALAQTSAAEFVSRLEQILGIAVGKQNRLEEEISCYRRAQAADPRLTNLDHRRACLLINLARFDEARDLFEKILAREPFNLAAHRDYNDLLYCTGQDREFLGSYDRAAPLVADPSALLLAKASFLMFARRLEEAHDAYERVLARDLDNFDAQVGKALALSHMRRFDLALPLLQTLVGRDPERSNLQADIALIHLSMGDSRKAIAMVEKALTMRPHDQFYLALLSTGYRMMGDEREDWLNDYFGLVRVFEVEPPDGYQDITAFNRELNAYLDGLHPLKREFINQSLRGGTQTTNNIFAAAYGPVEKLRKQIGNVVQRYIAELKPDDRHPFTQRRTNAFRYSGAWSSRLRDAGFHVNHVHTSGWISSCYYVDVPDVVTDAKAKQGWLKLGEPGFEISLEHPIARTIQPAPGLLVLFPSYTWHGTIPFHSPSSRTTIAFDVVPVG